MPVAVSEDYAAHKPAAAPGRQKHVRPPALKTLSAGGGGGLEHRLVAFPASAVQEHRRPSSSSDSSMQGSSYRSWYSDQAAADCAIQRQSSNLSARMRALPMPPLRDVFGSGFRGSADCSSSTTSSVPDSPVHASCSTSSLSPLATPAKPLSARTSLFETPEKLAAAHSTPLPSTNSVTWAAQRSSSDYAEQLSASASCRNAQFALSPFARQQQPTSRPLYREAGAAEAGVSAYAAAGVRSRNKPRLPNPFSTASVEAAGDVLLAARSYSTTASTPHFTHPSPAAGGARPVSAPVAAMPPALPQDPSPQMSPASAVLQQQVAPPRLQYVDGRLTAVFPSSPGPVPEQRASATYQRAPSCEAVSDDDLTYSDDDNSIGPCDLTSSPPAYGSRAVMPSSPFCEGTLRNDNDDITASCYSRSHPAMTPQDENGLLISHSYRKAMLGDGGCSSSLFRTASFREDRDAYGSPSSSGSSSLPSPSAHTAYGHSFDGCNSRMPNSWETACGARTSPQPDGAHWLPRSTAVAHTLSAGKSGSLPSCEAVVRSAPPDASPPLPPPAMSEDMVSPTRTGSDPSKQSDGSKWVSNMLITAHALYHSNFINTT